MQPRRRVSWSILVLATATAGGCNLIFGVQEGHGAGGGGSTSSTGSAGPSTSSTVSSASSSGAAAFAVSPSSVTLLAQSTFAFSTTGATSPVSWALADSSAGSLDQEGIYVAPLATGTFMLTATSGAATATATITVRQTAVPAVLVPMGALPTATGHGSQTHLVYATGTGEWWLFHDPAAGGVLATSFSKDFVSWTPGEQVALPVAPAVDGSDLSVAYRSLGGHDVVHISQGYRTPTLLGRYHLRASLTAGHAAFGAPQNINSETVGDGFGAAPDGTATLILPSGLVIDTTGFVATQSLSPPGSLSANCGGGDADVYTSDVMDTGATSFDAVKFGPQVLWCVPGTINARQLLALGSTAILLYVDGGSAPGGGANLFMSTSQNIGNWSPAEPSSGPSVIPPRVFPDSPAKSFGFNDWTAALHNGSVHAVRRLSDDTFEHRIAGSALAWGPGGAIPTQPTLQTSGLFLTPYGNGLVLVALGSNGGSQILYTAYNASKVVWSSWQTLTLDSAVRTYLAGFAPEGTVKPALLWTQQAGTGYAIGGLLLP